MTATRSRLAAMMFGQHFIWGAWFVTLGTYMQEGLGFGALIGLTFSMQGVASLVSPVFIGILADRKMCAQKLMGTLHLLGAAFLFVLSSVTEPVWFVLTALACLLCYMPTLPLSNTIAFNALGDSRKQFPAVRACGTIGWMIAGLAIGLMSGAAATSLPLRIAAAASLIAGLYAFTLPDCPPTARDRPLKIGDLFGLDIAGDLRRNKRFLVCACLAFVPLSFYFAYANPFFSGLGARVSVGPVVFEPAALQIIAQGVEFTLVLTLPWLLARWGTRRVLAFSLLAWSVAYTLLALAPAGASLPWIMPGIGLQGLCYALFFIAGQMYVEERFDEDKRARAQSFLALITFGVGQIVGFNLAGLAHNALAGDWRLFWAIPAALSFGVFLLFLPALRRRREAGPSPSEG